TPADLKVGIVRAEGRWRQRTGGCDEGAGAQALITDRIRWAVPVILTGTGRVGVRDDTRAIKVGAGGATLKKHGLSPTARVASEQGVTLAASGGRDTRLQHAASLFVAQFTVGAFYVNLAQ